MKSKAVQVRLRPDEHEFLAHICSGEVKRNTSEMIRLLISREYYRRTTGKSVVPDSAIATEFRDGRPRLVQP